ncbi:EcsC family protein [Phocaeicola dorei]|uniref:EcsC family protein n=1 Tax=Phocaeicola dorei TaxID=357276 RepID=UPI0018770C76|nr:EcsC family protein [Phocaeicola dorei]MBE5080644.1 EcsC family protein [Phocaeicola dorei]
MENEFSLLSQNIVLKSLDWAYEKAIYGVKGLDSAAELANNYLKGKGTLIEQVNSLIKWQNTKAGTSGFITGLGGLLTMPVTLPTNITSVLYIQIRMVAAIAIMGGYDVKDDRVKTLVYSCVAANSTAEVAKTFGLKLGEKLMKEGIKRLSKETIIRINQAVGFRLLTKFGQKGVINMGKSVPFIGGIISATFDIVSTNIIGNIAREIFIINEV